MTLMGADISRTGFIRSITPIHEDLAPHVLDRYYLRLAIFQRLHFSVPMRLLVVIGFAIAILGGPSLEDGGARVSGNSLPAWSRLPADQPESEPALTRDYEALSPLFHRNSDETDWPYKVTSLAAFDESLDGAAGRFEPFGNGVNGLRGVPVLAPHLRI